MLSNASFQSRNQGSLNQTLNRSRLFGFGSDYGDSIKDAKNVGKLKQGKSYDYSGDVGGSDLDFFKVKLEKAGKFFATLTNKSDGNQPIAITLLNKNGKAVKTGEQFLFSNVDAGQSQTLSVDRLKAGTYYLRLQSEAGRDEDYDLKLSQSGSNSPGSSSGGFNQAVNLGSLASGGRISRSGTVGGTDVDFYSFNVNNTSRIFATLDNSSTNANPIAISILNSQRSVVKTDSGRFLFSNVNAGASDTLFAPTLASGTYYVRVQSEVGRNESYNLELMRSSTTVTPL